MTPERWQEIEDLYQAAQKCGPEQRAALLARAGPEVRAEVESMLAPPAPEPQDESTVTLLAAASQLGPYRIESLIGEGGMGVVYRALDTKLNRPVAIKFLSDALADPAARRRFQREAQVAS